MIEMIEKGVGSVEGDDGQRDDHREPRHHRRLLLSVIEALGNSDRDHFTR